MASTRSGAPNRTDATPSDSDVLDIFEKLFRDFIVKRLSAIPNWEKKYLPPEIQEAAKTRHAQEKKMADVLNKPDYAILEYINFDAYGKIITRRDTWSEHFESVFKIKNVFTYKMDVIQSLRNDIRHGRRLNHVNRLRLRLHCYDLISQIYEHQRPNFRRRMLEKKLGLVPPQ